MYERFSDFGLSEKVLKAVDSMGYREPTPIQKIVMGPLLDGKDVIGVAQTGTGKTAAFGIPLVEKCPKAGSRSPYAVVLVPTRELAVQVASELNKIGGVKGTRAMAVYGGQPIFGQIKGLRKGIDILVGTPGRVIDHMERKTLILNNTRLLVLDEADEMLNMGFINDMERIIRNIPKERQTMLFSATMPEDIISISTRYMVEPEKIRANVSQPVVEKTKQVFCIVNEREKADVLADLLVEEKPSLSIVFCRTRRVVDRVSRDLLRRGFRVGAIHGDFSQSARDEVMGKFRKGRISTLVATDVAARGLDITGISHVINYSVPATTEGYIHRIGRTGRAGKSGIAITLVIPAEHGQLRVIEKAARTRIIRVNLPKRQVRPSVGRREYASNRQIRPCHAQA